MATIVEKIASNTWQTTEAILINAPIFIAIINHMSVCMYVCITMCKIWGVLNEVVRFQCWMIMLIIILLLLLYIFGGGYHKIYNLSCGDQVGGEDSGRYTSPYKILRGGVFARIKAGVCQLQPRRIFWTQLKNVPNFNKKNQKKQHPWRLPCP